MELDTIKWLAGTIIGLLVLLTGYVLKIEHRVTEVETFIKYFMEFFKDKLSVITQHQDEPEADRLKMKFKNGDITIEELHILKDFIEKKYPPHDESISEGIRISNHLFVVAIEIRLHELCINKRHWIDVFSRLLERR